ncbi:MAG: DUF2283 domain-containing protein [Ignavibacteria bacterium]|nr:DUF2283 domain-containing protein [Ignavibacteria bacterium]MBK7254722.1 DUF2283 domain-containing protein [Ignavibacteria bacterium]
MTKVKYSKDVDALIIELSDKKIDYADDKGNIIIHYTVEDEPVLLEIFDAKEFLLNSFASMIKEKEVVM